MLLLCITFLPAIQWPIYYVTRMSLTRRARLRSINGVARGRQLKKAHAERKRYINHSSYSRGCVRRSSQIDICGFLLGLVYVEYECENCSLKNVPTHLTIITIIRKFKLRLLHFQLLLFQFISIVYPLDTR